MSISGYPKVWHVGHRATAGIFSSPVIVQEKVDGSQISFAKLDGKRVVRGVQGGFAEWYKRQLAEQAFTEDVA